MNILQEFTSPDRILKLVVTEGEDGEKAIECEGGDWHTYADLIHLSDNVICLLEIK
jgi:hypothetical protein